MRVLVWLFKHKESNLPNSSIELYDQFVSHTIFRHLKTSGFDVSFQSITDISNLPEECKNIIQQLSTMCLNALGNYQLVFTEEEIRSACPNIDNVPRGISCFGLLQAVEHYSKSGMPTKTFNFIHCSIQEFLAAYKITCLSTNEELQFIQNNFFSEFYSNTLALYVGLTKGQNPSFKRFLTGYGKSLVGRVLSYFITADQISSKFFDDHRKCIWLFQCFHEASDQQSCNSITEKLRSKRVIHLSNKEPLLPSELYSLTVFFTNSSNTKWLTIDLTSCFIGDTELKMLHQCLVNGRKTCTIDEINLRSNSLTLQSSVEIVDIITSCKTIKLDVSCNSLENGLDLSDNNMLQELNITYNNLSVNGTTTLLSSLRKNKDNALAVLRGVHVNEVEKVLPELISFLVDNKVLKELHIITFDLFKAEHLQTILRSLQNNEVLKLLQILCVFCHYSNDEIREMTALTEKKFRLDITDKKVCIKN